ncbi:MAG: HEAT repeat domain-containing protein [Dehalococcoidia bacterium]|nr:HEAT repeat domain-containing protein [Dehalococcoidia bacterium]
MPAASSRELTTLLDRLIAGERPQSAELTLLSDLGREDTESVRGSWQHIPAAARVSVLSRVTELAEDNVELNFECLGDIALDDEHPEVRALAADALWESQDRRIAARLRDRLDDEDSEVRAAAARALRQFVILREYDQADVAEGDAVVDALRARAADPAEDEEVRASALESLGARSLPWVSSLIQEAFDGDERRLRIAAIHAMGDSADDRWLDYLYEQFYADDPEFRYESVIAAGAIGSEDALGPIADLLDDDDVEVVMAAVEALGEIGGDEAADKLQEFSGNAPDFMTDLVAAAIDAARDGLGLSLGNSADEDDD